VIDEFLAHERFVELSGGCLLELLVIAFAIGADAAAAALARVVLVASATGCSFTFTLPVTSRDVGLLVTKVAEPPNLPVALLGSSDAHGREEHDDG